MTAVAKHTGANIATITLVAGGSIVAGVVMAAGDRRAAVFTSISCGEKQGLIVQKRINTNYMKTRNFNKKHICRVLLYVPGGQLQV